MRQLTTTEENAMRQARSEFLKYSQEKSKAVEIGAAQLGFRYGFIAGLNYRQAELDHLAAENQRLREALRPFAHIAGLSGFPDVSSSNIILWQRTTNVPGEDNTAITLADCIAAREALAGSEEALK